MRFRPALQTVLRLATSPGHPKAQSFIYQVWHFLLLASMRWWKLLSPMLCTALLSYKAQWCRTGQISQVQEKMRPNWNWIGGRCFWQCAEWTFQSLFSQILIDFIVAYHNPGQEPPCILKTQPKNTDHPSPLIFPLKLAIPSSLRIQLPSPDLHFLHVSVSSQLLFYCLTSLRKKWLLPHH